MLQDLQVRHFEYETARSFEDVISAFERVVGTVEGIGWESVRNASKSVAEFESKAKERIGYSGFMRFLTIRSWQLAQFARPASQAAHVHDRESTDQWMIVVSHMKSK